MTTVSCDCSGQEHDSDKCFANRVAVPVAQAQPCQLSTSELIAPNERLTFYNNSVQSGNMNFPSIFYNFIY